MEKELRDARTVATPNDIIGGLKRKKRIGGYSTLGAQAVRGMAR